MSEVAHSTLEIKLDTSTAETSAERLTSAIIGIDTALGALSTTLDSTKARVFKVDVVLNNLNIPDEIGKIQRSLDDSNLSVKINAVLKSLDVRNEIAKIQSSLDKANGVTVKVSLNSSSVQADARAVADTISKTSAKIKVTSNVEEFSARQAILTRQSVESRRAAELAANNNWRTASEARIAQYKSEVDRRKQMDATYIASKAAFQERTAKNILTNLRSGPDTKQSSFAGSSVTSGSDIGAIRQQGIDTANAWRDMYSKIQAEAAKNNAITKEFSKSAINDIAAQTRSKIDALRSETALTKEERSKAIEIVRAGSREMVQQYKGLETSVKSSWDAIGAEARAVMTAGVATAKTTTDAKITEIRRLQAAEAALQQQAASASEPLSWLAARLDEAKTKAQGLVTIFGELGNTQHFEVVNSLKSQLDVLRQGFASLKISDNTQITSEFQNKLATAYDNARKAADAFSTGNNVVAQQFLQAAQLEYDAVTRLKNQILATSNITSGLTGKSQLSESMRMSAEQAEVLSIKFKEISASKFDNITTLQRQLEATKASLSTLAPTGAAQNVQILDLIAATYHKLESAALAAGKGQSYAFGMAMMDAQTYTDRLKTLQAEMSRFSNAKIQTQSLATQAEADAKAAIAAAKEVTRTKLAGFDTEVVAANQLLTARQRADNAFMRSYTDNLAITRNQLRENLSAQERMTVDSVNSRIAQIQRITTATTALPESRVGRIESNNTTVRNVLSSGMPTSNTTATTDAQIQAIQQITAAHAAGQNAMRQASSSAVTRMIGDVYKLVAAYGLLYAAYHSVISVFEHVKDVALESQKMATTMTVIAGSAAGAREELEWLRTTADKIGVSFAASAGPFAKFAAAAKGMFPTEQIKSMYEQLGKVSVAMHLDTQETKGVFLAMQQMASKGKVSLEELRLQFAERIPGAMTIAADTMDMTMAQFTKAVSSGLVSSEAFIPKFLTNLERVFGPAAEVASKGMMGALNRLGNALFAMWEKIGEGGAADAIRKSADKFSAFINHNQKLAEKFGADFGSVITKATDALMSFLTNDSAMDSFYQGLHNIATVAKAIAESILSIGNAIARMKGESKDTSSGSVADRLSSPLGLIGADTAARMVVKGKALIDNGLPQGNGMRLPQSGTSSDNSREMTANAEAHKAALEEVDKSLEEVNLAYRNNQRASSDAIDGVLKAAGRSKDMFQELSDSAVDMLKPKTLDDHIAAFKKYVDEVAEQERRLEEINARMQVSLENPVKKPSIYNNVRPETTPTQQVLEQTPIGQSLYKPLDFGTTALTTPETLDLTPKKASLTDLTKQLNEFTTLRNTLQAKFEVDRQKLAKIAPEATGFEAANAAIKETVKTIGAYDTKISNVRAEIVALENQQVKVRETAGTAITVREKEAQKLAEKMTEGDSKIQTALTDMQKLMAKEEDWSAMQPTEIKVKLTNVTETNKSMMAEYQAAGEQLVALEARKKELLSQSSSGGISSEKFITESAVVASESAKQAEVMSRLKPIIDINNRAIEEGSKAYLNRAQAAYKASNTISSAERDMVNKSQVQDMAKSLNADGIKAAFEATNVELEKTRFLLVEADRAVKAAYGDADKLNAAEKNKVDLMAKEHELSSKSDALRSASLEVHTKILNANKQRNVLEKELITMTDELNKKLGITKGYQDMTLEQLLKFKESASTMSVTAEIAPIQTPVIAPSIDTSEMSNSVQDWGKEVNVKIKSGVDISSLVNAESLKARIPPALAKAVIHTESHFNPTAMSTFKKVNKQTGEETTGHAYGLMQLLPSTAENFGVAMDEIYDVEKNVHAGISYLGKLFKMFGGDVALTAAAYNAGEGAIKKAGNRIPSGKGYDETRKYVPKVLDSMRADVPAVIKVKLDSDASSINNSLKTVRSEGQQPITAPLELDTAETQTNLRVVRTALEQNLNPIEQLQIYWKDYNRELAVTQSLTNTNSVEAMKHKEAQKLISAEIERQTVKARDYTTELKNRAEMEYQMSTRKVDNGVQTAVDRQGVQQLVASKGYSGLSSISSARASTTAELVSLEMKKNALAADLNNLTKTAYANSEDRLAKEIEIKDISAEIVRLQALQNELDTASIDLKTRGLLVLASQAAELKDITNKNNLGAKGSTVAKMKLELSADSFEKWQANQNLIDMQNFFDAAGFGIDSVASGFSNAFRQMAVDGKSFTQSLGDMFQAMTDRMLSASIDLVTSNAFALLSGSGGSWSQLGMGLIGAGVGLASKYLTKSNATTPSAATTTQNKNLYGTGQYAIADTSARSFYQSATIDSVRNFNTAVDTFSSVLRNNASKLGDMLTTYADNMLRNTLGGVDISGITKFTSGVNSFFGDISKFGEDLTGGWEKIVAKATDYVYTAGSTGATSGISSATNAAISAAITPGFAAGAATAGQQLGALGQQYAMNALGASLSSVSATSMAGAGLGATGQAAAVSAVTPSFSSNVGAGISASAGVSPGTVGLLGQVTAGAGALYSVIKLGMDLYDIASNEYTSTMGKISASFEAASTAALGVTAAVTGAAMAAGATLAAAIPVVGWVVAAALNVAAAATKMADEGINLANINQLFGGHVAIFLNDLMGITKQPSATMLAFNNDTPDKNAVRSEDGSYYTSTGPQSSSVGTETAFGILSFRYNDFENTVKQVSDTFLPTLLTIKAFDGALADSITSVDGTGDTMKQFGKLFQNREIEQDLTGMNTGTMVAQRFQWIGETLSKTETTAGQVAGAWISAFSKKMFKMDDANYNNQLQTLNIEAMIAASLPSLAKLPLKLADLFVESVKSVADGATQQEFEAQTNDFFSGWQAAEAGLKKVGIEIQNTTAVEYLTSLVGIGLTVKESGFALAKYAQIFKGKGADATKAFNESLDKMFATAKEKNLTKDQTKGYVTSTIALGGISNDIGVKSTSGELSSLALSLHDVAIKATQASNDVIDHAIADNKLKDVSRDVAIEQLRLAGKLDETTIASASYSKALTEAQTVMFSGIELANQQAVFFGTSLKDVGMSMQTLGGIGKTLTETFGDLAKAQDFLDSILQAAMPEKDFLAGKKAQAQSQFNSSAKSLGRDGLTTDQFKNYVASGGYSKDFTYFAGMDDKVMLGNLKNLGASFVQLTNANKNLDSALKSDAESSDKAAEKLKNLAELQKQVTDELNSINSSDIVKQIADINNGIRDMIAKAAEYGGTLSGIEELRTAKLQKLAADTVKPAAQEYDGIGKTSHQKSVDQVKIDMAVYWQQAKDLSDAGLLNFVDAQKGLTAIEANRLNVIKQKLTDMISNSDTNLNRKVLGVQLEQRFGNSNISSYATELLGLKDTWTQTIKDLYDNGASTPQLLHAISSALADANLAFDRAKKAITDFYQQRFDTIDAKRTTANDKIIELTQGKDAMLAVQHERALAMIQSDNFDKQMAGIDLLQNVTMDNLQAQLDAVKNIKKYVQDLKLGNLSPLTYTQRFTEARSQLETQKGLIAKGDTTALSTITEYETKYLEAAQRIYASSPAYTAIFKTETGYLDGLSGGASTDTATLTLQANQKQVDLLKESVKYLDKIANQQTTKRDAELDYLTAGTNAVGNEFIDNLQQLADAVGGQVQIWKALGIAPTPAYMTAQQQAMGTIASNHPAVGNAPKLDLTPYASFITPAQKAPALNSFTATATNNNASFSFTDTIPTPAPVDPVSQYADSLGWASADLLSKFMQVVPEPINFNHPGYVYTAPETHDIFTPQRDSQSGNDEESKRLLQGIKAELEKLNAEKDGERIQEAVDRLGLMLDQRTNENTQVQREAMLKAEARRQAMVTA